ncbi:MAG: DUF4276 family protein [Chloroflexota bacterium]
MVIWVFAGGGQAEANGLIPFLQAQFPQHIFDRKTPVGLKRNRKKPRKLNRDNPEKYINRQRTSGIGATAQSLSEQIINRLPDALKYETPCDLILVFDDLDCRDIDTQTTLLSDAINSVNGAVQISQIISFASPELESWIIADWDHVIGGYAEFKRHTVEMKLWLTNEANVSFDSPESFSEYDPQKDSCRDKLSKVIQDCADIVAHEYYSKDRHTSELITMLNPETVAQKCTHFRQLYQALTNLNQ